MQLHKLKVSTNNSLPQTLTVSPRTDFFLIYKLKLNKGVIANVISPYQSSAFFSVFTVILNKKKQHYKHCTVLDYVYFLHIIIHLGPKLTFCQFILLHCGLWNQNYLFRSTYKAVATAKCCHETEQTAYQIFGLILSLFQTGHDRNIITTPLPSAFRAQCIACAFYELLKSDRLRCKAA